MRLILTVYMALNLETGGKMAADFIAQDKDIYSRAVVAFSREGLRKVKKLPPAPNLDYELANKLSKAA